MTHIYTTVVSRTTVQGTDGYDYSGHLDSARAGRSFTSSSEPRAYKYVADQIRKGLSGVFTSTSDANIIRFLQSVAGTEQSAVVGPSTMKAYDTLANAVAAYDGTPRQKGMAGLKAVAKENPSLRQPDAEPAKQALEDLLSSSLWEHAVTDIEKTGKGLRIFQGYEGQEDIDTLSQSLSILGLVPADKTYSSYDGGLMDAVRNFNLVTRSANDLANMDTISKLVGEATLRNIQKALELSAEGKDWRDPVNWN